MIIKRIDEQIDVFDSQCIYSRTRNNRNVAVEGNQEFFTKIGLPRQK
jgi:hypothetical protein